MSQAEKIRSINAPGWDGLDADAELIRIHNTDLQRDIDIQFKRCFDTEAGQKVLEHLRSITIDQPAWVPGAEPSFGYAREGQNSIIREIEQRIKRANEPRR
tara:strand:- start:4534 stop:4836 length:303 start_codon:yes stop_codon:yes gene_type:complete